MALPNSDPPESVEGLVPEGTRLQAFSVTSVVNVFDGHSLFTADNKSTPPHGHSPSP